MSLATGRPLSELLDWPAADLVGWQEWYGRNGFPAERIVWGIALAAWYIGGCLGGKASGPRDLVAQLETAVAKRDRIRAGFDALVRPTPNG